MSHGLPDPPTEPTVDTSLVGLAPKFNALVVQLLAKNPDFTVAESLRTPERQQWLYGFGRQYDDGRGIVTEEPTNLRSWHGYGLAVDIVSKSKGWSANAGFWNTLGAFARDMGLVWGGDWTHFQDRPHIQFGGPMRQAPSQHAIDLYHSAGVEAVWQEVEAA